MMSRPRTPDPRPQVNYRHGDKGVAQIAAATSMVLQYLPADLQCCSAACPDVRVIAKRAKPAPPAR
jgi:hypothetical protein